MKKDNIIIKPYRELSGIMTFLKRIKRYFKLRISLNSGLVDLQRKDFSNLHPLKDISPLYIKEMSINDENQIKEWLNIINQSFLRNWGKKDFENHIRNHGVYNVPHTYFLMDNQKYIGVVSEAVFKKNKQIGATHYLGLHKGYLGRGLGKYLILYTLYKMKEHGMKSCEVESTLEHKESLFIHFYFGFSPKTKTDYWNTPNHASGMIRHIINYKVMRIYKEWANKKAY